jgi:hypothetical protein
MTCFLAKTDTDGRRISVEDLADYSGAAVSLEDREEAACFIEMHAEQLVCRAALGLGYGEPPAGNTFPLHNFARTQELWRGTSEDEGELRTDWFFPVGLFQEIVVYGSPVDNFPAGINGFCQTIAAVVAESKPRDFQILKDWRLSIPFTADEEAARLIWWAQRPSTHLPMRQSDAPQGKHTIDVGRFWKASVKALLLGEFAQGSATDQEAATSVSLRYGYGFSAAWHARARRHCQDLRAVGFIGGPANNSEHQAPYRQRIQPAGRP